MMSHHKQSLTLLLTLACILAVGTSALAQQGVVLSRPVLASLHPSATSIESGTPSASGTASAVVVVAGQNFVRGNTTILVQGTARQTTVINSEALAFELTASDLASPQTLMVSVVNHSGSKSFKSNSLPFVVLP